MADYAVSVEQDVIQFIWDELVAAEIMDPLDYYFTDFGFAVVPIFPVQEKPEFANRLENLPYIIYDVYGEFDDTDWWVLKENILLTIIAPSISDINKIKNLIIDKCRRFEESARAINANANQSGHFNINSVWIMSSEVSNEARQEGGRGSGEVVLCVKYVRYLDSSQNYL